MKKVAIGSNVSMVAYLAPRLLGFLDDASYVKLQYLRRFGRLPDLRSPATFNEKLLWLKLNYRRPDLPRLVHKYHVRDYVRELVGEHVLVPVHGYYTSASDIPFDDLPCSFVLKATHGSGWNIIVADKSCLDVDLAKERLSRWLRANFFGMGREWAYKYCEPGVICEAFLYARDGEPPEDIKFFCCNGRVHLVQVDLSRFTGHKRVLLDTRWERIGVELEYEDDGQAVPRPENLEEMIEVAEILSKDFPFVRVDLYSVAGKTYFGELTYYPGKGVERFRPASYDLELGGKLILK